MTSSEHWFDIEPVPASRPRFRTFQVKGRPVTSTYYAGKYKKFLAEAEKVIPEANVTHDGNLSVTVVCVVSKPKSTKRVNPNGDVDNYAKGILDVMTKKDYWNDDMQIVRLVVEKVWVNEPSVDPVEIYMNFVDPGIYVEITEV